MKNLRYLQFVVLLLAAFPLWSQNIARPGSSGLQGRSIPVISSLTYDSIDETGVTLFWTTDVPADSKVWWMASDSNYQPVVFTDSMVIAEAVTVHIVPVSSLQPGKIFRYQVTSGNGEGTATDSGYFITQSASSGSVEAYFNHTVDTTVSTGEKAKGDQDFETLLIDRIEQANHSIDITLWEFANMTAIADELVKAKDRGVKVRFIYNHAPNTPLIDTLLAHGIPVLKREFDTTYAMHNKFWIFDYRSNPDAGTCYLNTGSANVSHPMFHTDRNNMIVIQDKSLCAVYTRQFEQMWGSHGNLPDTTRSRFGTQKTDNVPHLLNVDGTRMEVWFCPTGNISLKYCDLFHENATKSVFFCMFKFYLTDIEDTLHALFNRGMGISGVFDSSHAFREESVYPRLKGIASTGAWNPPADVFFDPIDGLLHHKYCIIDADAVTGNKITVTGSYNWDPVTNAGNDENSLVIFSPRINNLYYQEFMARYKESGGSLVGSGIREIDSGPSIYSHILKIFPNPCVETATAIFTISLNSHVVMELFDNMGRKVEILANQVLGEGKYEILLNTSLLPQGIYFLRLQAGTVESMEKIVVWK